MNNRGILKINGKHTITVGTKQLVLAVFRLSTLSLALIELAFDDPGYTYFPGIYIAIGAVLYTFFKLVHPLRWYQSTLPGIALITVDVAVSAFLLIVHRQIHTPFTLYALNPVLISALLMPARVTWITVGVTAVYYTANFFSYPLTTSLPNLSSMFSSYIIALGLMAWLPYVINSRVLQNLQSRIIYGERRKLGREIHDGLCQTIYGLRLEMQMLNRTSSQKERLEGRLAHLKKLLDEAEKEARGSLELLRSFRMDRPFLPQIEDSLKHLESTYDITYHLEAPRGEPRMDDLVKLEVLHVCEEALMNVVKHSGAKRVTVGVYAPNGQLKVTISDDGRGMANDGLAKGHGLTVMKERAESLGGNFQVISAPGSGTEIRLEVPRKCFQELQPAKI